MNKNIVKANVLREEGYNRILECEVGELITLNELTTDEEVSEQFFNELIACCVYTQLLNEDYKYLRFEFVVDSIANDDYDLGDTLVQITDISIM